jgi:hypothetical protein
VFSCGGRDAQNTQSRIFVSKPLIFLPRPASELFSDGDDHAEIVVEPFDSLRGQILARHDSVEIQRVDAI